MTTHDEAAFPDVDTNKRSNGAGRKKTESENARRANRIPIERVATWLGLLEGETIRCPGYTLDQEKGEHYGVHFYENALKCPHDRCKGKGIDRGEGGLRTCVVLVAEVRGVTEDEAVRLLLEQFDPPPRVLIEQLSSLVKSLKRKNDNRSKALGALLNRVCEGEPVEADAIEQLTTLLGSKFHDCDPRSIAAHFEESIAKTGKTVEDMQKLIEAAQAAKSTTTKEQPETKLGQILIEPDPEKMAHQAQIILAKVNRSGVPGDEFFQHGTEIARIVFEKKPAKRIQAEVPIPILKGAPFAAIRGVVGRAFWFRWEEGRGDEPVQVRVLPPDWAVTTLQACTNWPLLPNVETVAECPVMRADGTVVSAPGYDEISGVYLQLNDDYPPVPDNPTQDQLQAAVAAIDEVFFDVPFEKPEHKAAAFAAILTLVGRNTFDGPAPCFVTEATIAGSGKDNLVRLISIIGTGSLPFSSHFTEDEEEQRKRLTSIAMAGLRIVLFGNVVTDMGDEHRSGGKGFGGGPLCDALTTTRWADRVLGEHRDWSGTLKTVFFASANNMLIQQDMHRRVCPIRLDWGLKGVADPSKISDDYWKHPDVIGYAMKNRPTLVAAALTILRAYFAAECPDMQTSSWGSYEKWARTILGAVKFAGLADPGEGRQQFAERADFGGKLRAQFVSSLLWLQEEIMPGKAMLAADILTAVREQTGTVGTPPTPIDPWVRFERIREYAALTEALQGLTLADNAERTVRVHDVIKPVLPNALILGKLLSSQNGTLYDITQPVRPPTPPPELTKAVAQVQDQPIWVREQFVGWKDPDGTMVWDFVGIIWCALPDGRYERKFGTGDDDWTEEWQMITRHYPASARWRVAEGGATEMWSEETAEWIPQPRIKVRVVRTGEDRNHRAEWGVERVA